MYGVGGRNLVVDGRLQCLVVVVVSWRRVLFEDEGRKEERS